MTNRILSAVNNDGFFKFNTNGTLTSNSLSISLNSKSDLGCLAKNNINLESEYLKLTSLDTKIKSSNINLNGCKTIILKCQNDELLLDEGNILLNSSNGIINIGKISENTEELTHSIGLEALRKITFNSEDIYGIASDSIHFISQSGDISFGSNMEKPFIKFENDNMVLNQISSSTNRILDINIDKDDNINDYQSNGILIKSDHPSLTPDIQILNNNKQSINMGINTSHSNNSIIYNKTHLGYQEGYYLYNLGCYYISSEYTKQLSYYFSNNNKQCFQIENTEDIIISEIIENSDFQIKVELTEDYKKELINNINKKSTSTILIKKYVIEIDNQQNNNNFTFRWKFEKENDFKKENSNIEITKSPILIDNNNISILFSVLSGYEIGDNWSFNLIQKLKVSEEFNSNHIMPFYVCFNNINTTTNIKNTKGYLMTSNNDLLIASTETPNINKEHILISRDNGIKMQTTSLIIEKPEINNIIYNIDNIIDANSQLDNKWNIDKDCIPYNNDDGYLVVWCSSNKSKNNIYLERFLNNGLNYPKTKREIVNIQRGAILKSPSLAFIDKISEPIFIVAWASLENQNQQNSSNIYNIYANIFINNKKKKGFDIPISRFYNNSDNIGLKCLGLTNNTFLIIWYGANNNVDYYKLYGLIIDINGNIVKQTFLISEDNQLGNVSNPHIVLFRENQLFSVIYNLEIITNTNNNDREVSNNIYYNIFNFEGTSRLKENSSLKSKHLTSVLNKNLISCCYKDANIYLGVCNKENKNSILKYKLNIEKDNTGIIKYGLNLINTHLLNDLNTLGITIQITNNNHLFISMINKDNQIVYSLINNDLSKYLIYNTNFTNTYSNKYCLSSFKFNNDIEDGLVLSWIENKTIIKKRVDLYNPLLNLLNDTKSYIKVSKRGNIHLGESRLSEWNTSTLSINGSLSTNIKHINKETYILNEKDNVIICHTNENINKIKINLDNNHTFYGRIYKIKKVGSVGVVEIKSLNNQIDKLYEMITLKNNEAIELQSDGVDWYILNCVKCDFK